MTVDCLFCDSYPRLLAEVVSSQLREIIVRVDVIEGEDEVNERLPTVNSNIRQW